MANEYLITEVRDFSGMLLWMAKRLRLSPYALCSSGGSTNTSLTGFATGSKPSNDLSFRPLQRILQATSYELVARPKGGEASVILRRDTAMPLKLTAMDGGRIEIPWTSMDEIRTLLNTLALTKDMTVTGLVKATGIASSSLVSLAMNNSANNDVRLAGILRIINGADFEAVCRPVHLTRRDAIRAFSQANRG